MNETSWYDEMVGVRKMISKFTNIPESDIKGIRAPFLPAGGDDMLKMLLLLPELMATPICKMDVGLSPMITTVTWTAKLRLVPNAHFPGFGANPFFILKMGA